MRNIIVVIRGKERTFTDMGDGKCRDKDNGEVFQVVVTSPNGGYLRGGNRKNFTFPRG